MTGPRRLRLVGAGARSAGNFLALTPVAVPAGSIAIAESAEGVGALAFAVMLADAFQQCGSTAFMTVCDFDSAPALPALLAARLQRMALAPAIVQVAHQEDLARLALGAERHHADSPCLFVGAPAVLGLQASLKIVIAPEGTAASLTPGARRLRAEAQLVLSSARAGVAQGLAAGWHLPTRSP